MKKNLQHDEFRETFDSESQSLVDNIASSMAESDAATGIDPHAVRMRSLICFSSYTLSVNELEIRLCLHN